MTFHLRNLTLRLVLTNKIRIAGADFGRDNCIHLQPSESSDDVDNVVLAPKSKWVSRACLH